MGPYKTIKAGIKEARRTRQNEVLQRLCTFRSSAQQTEMRLLKTRLTVRAPQSTINKSVKGVSTCLANHRRIERFWSRTGADGHISDRGHSHCSPSFNSTGVVKRLPRRRTAVERRFFSANSFPGQGTFKRSLKH